MMESIGNIPGASSLQATTLESLRVASRPVLIFAPSSDDPRFLEQRQLCMRGASDARQRQVVFVQILYRNEAGAGEAPASGEQSASFPREEASKARRRFGVAPAEFTVVLIGKDGGEKFRTHTPVTIEKLNALIDAMPMRQQEVRDGNSK